MDFFKNEDEVIEIGGLTVENRIDRVSMYGSIDLTPDREGLLKARILFYQLQSLVMLLEYKVGAAKDGGITRDETTTFVDEVNNPWTK